MPLSPERGMILSQENRKMRRTETMAIIIALLSAALLCTASPRRAWAAEEITEGYDENTEISVSGTLTELLPRERGPVIVRLRTDGKSYLVVTAPPHYLYHENIELRPGSSLEVRGSKFFGGDGNIYIISRVIRLDTGRVIVLRGRDLRPLWRRGRY